ncbi:beta-1,3-glucanase family protein [Sanguibacter sp. 25GB23B1]|uniref:beta-1,3-glucanase family protein n=1 Tax=unclassified Sanguibacter TaxID=2645534 RepID=UPI0032AFE5A4
MTVRSKVLAGLAMLALAAPLAVGSVVAPAPAVAAGPSLLPFTVTNDSGRPEAVYLYTVGVDLASGRLGYVTQDGTFTAWPAGSNPATPAPDASIRMGGSGSTAVVNVPKGFSGRMYMAFGQKLDFRLTPDGLVQPAPWSPGDPNRDILFDWSEFTYADGGLYLNSSQVDMFAVPHKVSVTDASGATRSTGQVINNGRNNVIDGIRNQPGWADTIYTRADGTVLRVLAPGKAAETGMFDKNYLDPYINEAWNAYATKTLTVVPFAHQPDTRYFGRTVGSTMTFTDGAGRQVASFQKPSTSDVWGCDGALSAPNDLVVGPIARTLCAAMHRTTLGRLDTQPSGGAADFYQGEITNHYSRLVHQNMVDGKAYGFAFDDVQAQESLVSSGDPRAAAIVLSPFGATSGTTPPPAAGGSIVSTWHGKCIDVPNWNFVDRQRMIVWDCAGGTNQKFEFTDGTVRSQNGKCLDVAGGSKDNGTAIQLYTCNGSAAQKFVLSAAGDLVNPQADKCVDITGWNPSNGAELQLWECTGTANQKWSRA